MRLQLCGWEDMSSTYSGDQQDIGGEGQGFAGMAWVTQVNGGHLEESQHLRANVSPPWEAGLIPTFKNRKLNGG